MLAFFRKSLPALKWILLLVIATFVLFFGVNWWNPGSGNGEGGPEAAARVGETSISFRDWQAQAEAMDRQYRQMFGERYGQIREQLGIERMALDSLIRQELLLADARRLGLSVSDQELSAAVHQIPALQVDGKFVGLQEMRKRVVQYFRMSEQEFTQQVENQLIESKWRQVITAGVLVSPADVEAEYRRRHEKLNVEYVALPLDRYEAETAAPADAELRSFYDQNIGRYKEGEGRRALYALFDEQAAASRVQPTEAEITAFYEQNRAQFESPEQRRARHVLIAVPAEAPASQVEAARAKAQQIAQRAKGGEDFAALASQYSDDPGSKVRGGDLGFFPRGKMVPEFDTVVFSAPLGAVSDVIRTQFGFHVIKVEQSQPAGVQPLEQVRKQIEGQLRFQKLTAVAGQMAQEFVAKLKAGTEFRAAAKELGVELQDTGVVTRASNVPGLGAAPALIEAIFALEQGKFSEPVVLPRGQAVAWLQESIADYSPPYELRRERVRSDFLRERSRERAKAELTRAAAAGDLAAVAKALKLELRKAPVFTRGQELPEVGFDARIEQGLFAAAPGRSTTPLDGPRAVVLARVLTRESADMSKLAGETATIRETLRSPLVERVIQERMIALRKEAEASIWINPSTETRSQS